MSEAAAGRGATLRVALGEYDTGWHDPAASLDRAERIVADAARAGARLVVLPETCAAGFTMETGRWAEPLDGPAARRLGAMAAANGVWLLAGLTVTGDAPARAHNVAALIDASGALVGGYRKQRLFAFAGEDESYAPGDAPLVTTIDGVRVSPFICFDLRFPELFRAVADDVDALLLIANWPATRRPHWDALLRARAIENQCYVVAVNRTGVGGGVEYDGGSAAFDPWGEPLGVRQRPTGGPVVVTIDADLVAATRDRYPFLRARHQSALA